MNSATQRLCVWCGPGLMVVLGVGFFIIAGLLPPPLPSLGPEQIAEYYADNAIRIRVGLVIALLGAGLMFPWVSAITLQMRRAEGQWSPLSLTQLLSGAAVSIALILPWLFMATAAFRPERDPEVTQAISDLGWLTFVGYDAPAMFQNLAIGMCILRDRSATPVFPRWVGFFNLSSVIVYAPGQLVICFQGGPFAWNGLFALWLVIVVFAAWIGVMTWATLRAIKQQEDQHAEQFGPDHVVAVPQ